MWWDAKPMNMNNEDRSDWVSALDKLMKNPNIHEVKAEKFTHVMLNPDNDRLTLYDPVKNHQWINSDTYVEVTQ